MINDMEYIDEQAGAHRLAFKACISVRAYGQPRATPTGRGRVYRDRGSNCETFRQLLAAGVREQYDGPPLTGALVVNVTWYLPRAKSQQWRKKPMDRIPHVVKPDLDNLDKSTLDALNGILWKDDAQIYHQTLTKLVCAGDEKPHVFLTVYERI